jgi:predicted phosphoadenosine phosphosulfate sulfurtransferase
MPPSKKGKGISVLEAARQRVSDMFENFPCVYVSFSAGKDSSVMLDLVAAEARRRGRRFGLLLIDLEAQYKLTIEHAEERFSALGDVADPYWICLPLHLRNATSQIAPYWVCWDPEQRETWVRQPPSRAITDGSVFPWFRAGMEFEEFIEDFGHWYGRGKATCCLVGIRCNESLDRWRAIVKPKHSFEGRCWTTWKGRALFNAYPLYDWRTEDIWTYNGREGAPYNRLYDLMHQAGVSIHAARICQPYGDDQRRGLWLYHILEPETWPRVVARVTGANAGALYASERGNMIGRGKIECPPGHTWESYARFLLRSMPDAEAEHFAGKIAIHLHWYSERGYPGGVIPDAADPKDESRRKVPSWRRICKALLKNDRLCKSLGFTQQRSSMSAYEKYRRTTAEKRARWGLI